MLEATLEPRNGGFAAKVGDADDRDRRRDGDGTPRRSPRYVGRHVILGIRPEDLEDAALVRRRTPDERGSAATAQLPEALGSEIMVHFTIEGAHGRHRGRARARAGRRRRPRGRASSAERTRRRSSAASAPARACDPGEHVEVAVDTRSLHFFDPETGLGIYDQRARKEPSVKRSARSAGAVLRRSGSSSPSSPWLAGVSATSGRPRRGARNRASPGAISLRRYLDRVARPAAFGRRDQAPSTRSTRTCKVNYKPVGDNLPTVLSTAIAGGNPPDMADIAQPGLVDAARAAGRAEADHVREVGDRANFAPAWQQLGTVHGKLYALVFKAANKSIVWYNVPAFKAAGVTAAEDVGAAARRREDDQGVGDAGLLDRRRRRLDAHRPVREHLPAHVGPAKYDQLTRPQDQVDRPVGEDGAEDDGEDHRRHARTSPAARAARCRPTSRRR